MWLYESKPVFHFDPDLLQSPGSGDHSNHTSRQALELTTETCDWHQQPGAKHRWEATQSEGSLFVPGSEAFLSGFKITELKRPAGTPERLKSRFGVCVCVCVCFIK